MRLNVVSSLLLCLTFGMSLAVDMCKVFISFPNEASPDLLGHVRNVLLSSVSVSELDHRLALTD